MYQSPSSFLSRQGLFGWTSVFFLFTVLQAPILGQSTVEIKSNQKKLKAEIAITQSNLNKLQKDKTINLSRYNTLSQQIKSRDALIKSMEIELDFIDADLVTQEADITLLKSQYDDQRERYKDSVKDYHKFRTTYSPVAFIFSSSNLITAWKRLTFYQSLSRYHQSQIIKLQRKEDELLLNLQTLKDIQSEKEHALQEVQVQKSKITKDQKSKKSELDRLKKNEGFLKKRLVAQEAQSKKLSALMTKLVEASIKSKSAKALPVEAKKLNTAFGANKGQLPWPVSKGYVGKKFGKQRHPDLKMIYITNNGIDIVTEEGAEILAVFEGKVMAVQTVAGFNNTILINHGTYYTVYANVDNVAVSAGEKVTRGQSLAYAASSDNGSSLHFELWKGKTLQNPSLWLKKR